MPIELPALKGERDKLKEELRALDADQRKLETEIKNVRQREIRLKREIEALSTLIEMQDGDDKNGNSPKVKDAGATADA